MQCCPCPCGVSQLQQVLAVWDASSVCCSASLQVLRGEIYKQEYFVHEIVQFVTSRSFPTRIAGECSFCSASLQVLRGESTNKNIL